MKLVIIDGIIGEGKTTVIDTLIKKHPNFKRISEIAEDAEINLIEMFKDSNPSMRENLFMSKIALDYFKILSEAKQNDIILADRIFSSPKYWALYHGYEPSAYLLWLIEEVKKVLNDKQANILYVYLENKDKNILMANIKKRGRLYEQSIKKEDLLKLEAIYKNAYMDLNDLNAFYTCIQLSPDFYQNEEHILLSLIENL